MTAWLMLVVTTAYALTSVAMYFSNRQMAHAAQRQAIAAIKQADAATQQIALPNHGWKPSRSKLKRRFSLSFPHPSCSAFRRTLATIPVSACFPLSRSSRDPRHIPLSLFPPLLPPFTERLRAEVTVFLKKTSFFP